MKHSFILRKTYRIKCCILHHKLWNYRILNCVHRKCSMFIYFFLLCSVVAAFGLLGIGRLIRWYGISFAIRRLIQTSIKMIYIPTNIIYCIQFRSIVMALSNWYSTVLDHFSWVKRIYSFSGNFEVTFQLKRPVLAEALFLRLSTESSRWSQIQLLGKNLWVKHIFVDFFHLISIWNSILYFFLDIDINVVTSILGTGRYAWWGEILQVKWLFRWIHIIQIFLVFFKHAYVIRWIPIFI